MKNDVLVPPQAEDIEPYDSDRSVVRLFDKMGIGMPGSYATSYSKMASALFM